MTAVNNSLIANAVPATSIGEFSAVVASGSDNPNYWSPNAFQSMTNTMPPKAVPSGGQIAIFARPCTILTASMYIIATIPNTNAAITWTSEYGEDLGRTNFLLLALHVLNGTPYLVAEPNLCLSYNKWGRPNPPYVFFKYDGKAWQRITHEEFPAEFTTLNVAISLDTRHVQEMVRLGVVPAENIRQRNSRLPQPEFKAILREAVKPGSEGSAVNCEEMVYYKGAWVGPGDSIGKRMMDNKSK